MSRRWLLSLLCLSVFVLSLVQLTRARGEFKVRETNTRILFDKRPAELMLAVENSTGERLNTTIELEVIDPRNNVKRKLNQNQSIATGKQKLNLPLPLHFSDLTEHERSDLLWYRLRYSIKEAQAGNTIAAGIISFSEITPDIFDLRVATSEVLREKDRLIARVQALHPLTRRPAPSVQIDGEVLLNSESDKKLTLRSVKTTDSTGHALLEFTIPPLFPQFPYNARLDNAEINVVGRKGGIAAVVKGSVLIDQFVRSLVSSDKPLYQPGQVMHIRALLFTPAKRALANQNASIRICDPDGTTVYRAIAATSRFGVATTDWSIPENTRLGEYQIWVGIDGGDEAAENGIPVRISRYELPNFTVNVEADRAYYLPGQNAEVKVRADYLFGKPVARGHVRVVRETERHWNYTEQKWEVEEGDTHEGETDAKGIFATQINLASDHEDIREDNQQFKDFTYAAYFTDPTTNRTEQRRFDLRVTREAIHVYIIHNNEWVENKSLPLKFYVSTSYADGSPAQARVNVSVSDESSDLAKPSFATVRTNRYGLAKVSGLRLPKEFEDSSEMELAVSVVDSKGQKGSQKEEISFEEDEDEQTVRVETDKALYRSGEPITAFVTSSLPEQTVIVDLLRESSLIRSERVKLHRGSGSVVFAYRPDFKDKLTLRVYGQTPKWQENIGSHAVLYPRDPELKVGVRSTQASYRPGEDAQVNLSVRSPEGQLTESALGVVVIDKAVEERFRTDREFGSPVTTVTDSLRNFQGADAYFGGMNLLDLQRLDLSKPISPDMELVADVLLSQRKPSFRTFHGDNQYESDQAAVFGDSIKEQLKPVREALESRYAHTLQYPTDEQSLRRLLLESKIDFNGLRDPWGGTYRTWFTVFQHSDDVLFESAGADKRFDTADDFVVYRLGWPYFRPMGEAINKAVNKYYDRTGKFVHDSAALREAVAADGINLDQMLDRWGKPYRFEFDVKDNNYIVNIKSGGSDQQFSDKNPYSDDFVIWTASTDYFHKTRARIGEALQRNSENSASFPENEKDLRAILQNSIGPLETFRDPWGRNYYVAFKTESVPMDRVQVEDRSSFEQPATTRTTVNPVIQTVRFISLRSVGPDAKRDTADDFSVAVFTGVLSEQRRSEPPRSATRVVFKGGSGGIQGVITDLNGAVIPGTTVTATLSAERRTYQTSTNEIGKYSFINLLPGMYELRFEATGFQNHVVTNVLVRASHVVELNLNLSPGSVSEVVTVSAGAELFVSLNSTVGNMVRGRNGSVNVITKSGSAQQLSTPLLREYFPETLLWQPSIETDKHGRAQINFKLADNITTWKILVVGSTEDGQIGITEKEIKAFQPFFLDHDPPRVLTEGDEISLPVTVRNYLERQQKVDLEIKTENWFSLIGPTRKQIRVAPSDAKRETFDLRAIASIKNGKQRITAVGSDDSDAIEKPVTVHPDGEELSVTDGDIIADRSVLELDIPETMIPNSKRAELKIYPNLMTHVVESVEGIMQRPYGCGEQTISSTFPSLLLSRYYKQNGGNFPLRGRAERYVKEGYDRLLTYRHKDGGFTYWGTGEPDLALTAYALRFLTSASDVIAVDREVIKKACEWLASEQQPDGSWGYPMITAYVSRVLAQASPESSDVLKKAIAYLSKNVSESRDPYLLAQYSLTAIESGDVARAKPAIEKLRSLSHTKRAAQYWTTDTSTPFHGWGLAGQVEATALVVQALSRYCDSQNTGCEVDKKLINLGLLFILKEKDRYGVWHSTQATINSIDTMLVLLKQSASQGGSGETQVLVNRRIVQSIEIRVADRLNNPITIDITESVNPGKNRIEFRRAVGLPLATVQAVASFYVPWADSSARSNGMNGLRLHVKFNKTEGSINEEITCNVEAERVGSRGDGMLLAEIGLPPGAEVDRSSLEAAMKKSGWTINRYDVLPDRVVVYLWPPTGGVQFNFKFRPRLGMNARTAPSTMYDYYNPESRAVVAPVKFKVR